MSTLKHEYFQQNRERGKDARTFPIGQLFLEEISDWLNIFQEGALLRCRARMPPVSLTVIVLHPPEYDTTDILCLAPISSIAYYRPHVAPGSP